MDGKSSGATTPFLRDAAATEENHGGERPREPWKGELVKSIVYAGLDAIITSFSLISSISAGRLSSGAAATQEKMDGDETSTTDEKKRSDFIQGLCTCLVIFFILYEAYRSLSSIQDQKPPATNHYPELEAYYQKIMMRSRTEDMIKNKFIVQRLQEDCLYELWWYNLGRLKGYPDAATPRCTTLHNMGIRPQFGIPKHLRIYADHAEADVPFPNNH